ncbi:MAG: S1 RNA-binding domain-containing protein [Veillonella sp.]
MAIEVGNIIDGTVSGITKFGVFVDLGEKQTGLVHISEVAHGYVEDINAVLKVEDPVKVKVLSIEGNKIGLSIRQTQPKETVNEERRPRVQSKQHRGLKNEIILARSNERLHDLKRNTEGKRGGRGGRRVNSERWH